MIDQEKVKKAVRLLLEGIGEDADREGLIETPDRMRQNVRGNIRRLRRRCKRASL